jgi:hypothetical protein
MNNQLRTPRSVENAICNGYRSAPAPLGPIWQVPERFFAFEPIGHITMRNELGFSSHKEPMLK